MPVYRKQVLYVHCSPVKLDDGPSQGEHSNSIKLKKYRKLSVIEIIKKEILLIDVLNRYID